MEQRIVRVGSLEEFTAEVRVRGPVLPGFEAPRPLVRLSLTDKEIPSSAMALSATEFALHLQGTNELGEIVWLMESHRTVFEEEMFRDVMLAAFDLVKAHLLAAGYNVRGGSYGLPADVEPLRGRFECFAWQNSGEGGTAHPIWQVAPAAAPLPPGEGTRGEG